MAEVYKSEDWEGVRGRLIKMINHSGKSKSAFFHDMDIPFNTARNWLIEGKGIGAELFTHLPAYYPDYDLEWLITGNGEMTKSDSEGYRVNENKPEYTLENTKLKDQLIKMQHELIECIKEKNQLILQLKHRD